MAKMRFFHRGKRETGETDQQALVREIKEELEVELVAETLEYYGTFMAQAHGKPEGVMVRIACYTGEFKGEPRPSTEIAELVWITSHDGALTTETGRLILGDLKNRDLID